MASWGNQFSAESKLARAARDAARATGEATYIGQPCVRNGHSGLRYTASKDCVECGASDSAIKKILEAKRLDIFVARNLNAFETLEHRAEARNG